MKKSKVKIGNIYTLNWKLIKEQNYECKCGGTFHFLKRRNNESKIKGEVLEISSNRQSIHLRFFNKNDEYIDYFWVFAEKLIPVSNTIKKVK